MKNMPIFHSCKFSSNLTRIQYLIVVDFRNICQSRVQYLRILVWWDVWAGHKIYHSTSSRFHKMILIFLGLIPIAIGFWAFLVVCGAKWINDWWGFCPFWFTLHQPPNASLEAFMIFLLCLHHHHSVDWLVYTLPLVIYQGY